MSHKRQHGFTLLELMIVVAVIAIIASIAYPSYNNYIRQARLSGVQQFMLEIANKQEQYLLDARQYTNTIGNGGLNLVTPSEVDGHYDVDVTGAPGGYTITAVPKGTMTGTNTQTLNNLGVKTPASDWK